LVDERWHGNWEKQKTTKTTKGTKAKIENLELKKDFRRKDTTEIPIGIGSIFILHSFSLTFVPFVVYFPPFFLFHLFPYAHENLVQISLMR
jgi:hypothetical protein